MAKHNPFKKHKLINDYYTLGEEIANSITHGIGAALSISGFTILIVLASIYGDTRQIVSFAIYGGTLITLYLASTLYHSLQHPPLKRILRIVDHSCIFLLIAGTYTPFLLVAVRGALGYTMLVVVWGIAILGIAFKTMFIHRFEVLSVLAYVGMGWLCVIVWHELVTTLSTQSLYLLAAGGAFYTAGIIFYALRRMPYNHAVWHVFVLGGSICHYFAILPLASSTL